MSCHDRRFHEDQWANLLDKEREARWDRPAFLLKMGILPGQALLDLGCGPGFWTFHLAEAAGSTGLVWALDVSGRMLESLAEQNPPPQVKPLLCELPLITLPDASVDLVWASFIFHEVVPHADMAAEIRRVTRPGGKVAVLDWHPDAPSSKGPPRSERLTAGEIISFLTGAGFQKAEKIWESSDHYMVAAC
ncbi:MAG: methyltransferase domain-containing protein [Candidatus Eremiobacteraeota bacterium]|nr:methyltransferase domain-containing protein [Candidatus Eremiobacteraeota bacterium]